MLQFAGQGNPNRAGLFLATIHQPEREMIHDRVQSHARKSLRAILAWSFGRTLEGSDAPHHVQENKSDGYQQDSRAAKGRRYTEDRDKLAERQASQWNACSKGETVDTHYPAAHLFGDDQLD